MPIKSSEPNSHSCPRLPIDANQIKWFKTHILFLDFDLCPIEVMFTLHLKWTSIGSLGWIALSPCKDFILRRGWVEKNTHSPHDSNSESFQWPTELHILFHYGVMNILELCWYFLTFTDKIRMRTEDTIVALHPESIQGIVFSQGTDV